MSTILKPITKAKAESVFREFKKHYGDLGYDTSEARLVFDWHEGGHPAIVWEGNAPSQWAINWWNRQTTKGTFCEPYYSFVLCIYPEF